MGLFNFFRKKKEQPIPHSLMPSSGGPWDQQILAIDPTLNPLQQPLAFQQQHGAVTEKDLQLIASKLDLILSRLDTLIQYLQLSRPPIPPQQPIPLQPQRRTW